MDAQNASQLSMERIHRRHHSLKKHDKAKNFQTTNIIHVTIRKPEGNQLYNPKTPQLKQDLLSVSYSI